MTDKLEKRSFREPENNFLESRSTLEKIGKHLQFKLAKIVTEPLPEKIASLLNQINQERGRH